MGQNVSELLQIQLHCRVSVSEKSVMLHVHGIVTSLTISHIINTLLLFLQLLNFGMTSQS